VKVRLQLKLIFVFLSVYLLLGPESQAYKICSFYNVTSKKLSFLHINLFRVGKIIFYHRKAN
jgi:hypothetical protein